MAGCLLGGWASDRFGRRPAAVTALAISAACCIASPLFFTAPTVVLVVFLLVWGAAVIADSGVFSTSLSEIADKRLVGTALTAQTAIGFLLTVVTIHLVPVAADLDRLAVRLPAARTRSGDRCGGDDSAPPASRPSTTASRTKEEPNDRTNCDAQRSDRRPDRRAVAHHR